MNMVRLGRTLVQMEVEDDSMLNLEIDRYSFPKGCSVQFDWSNNKPKDKQYVVAYDERTDKYFVRQYIKYHNSWKLKAYNPEYPMISKKDGIFITGVIINRIISM